jgi:hypothetical protein
LHQAPAKNMSLTILKGLVQLVILLITFECVTPIFTVFDGEHASHFSLSSKKPASSLLNTVAFEKAEEERGKEERDKFLPIEIADFTRIATLLAEVHTPRSHVISFDYYRCESQPALFKLHHVFLI